MKKTAFYFGTISGIVMVIFFIIPVFIYGNDIDFRKSELVGYTSMLLCLTAVFFGIKKYRDKQLGGKISFGAAFGLGSEISGIAGLIFGIYTYILYKYWSPNLYEKIMDYYKDKIVNSGQSQEVIAQQLKQFQEQSAMYANPIAMAIVMVLTVFAIGLVISLLSALILKRKEIKPLINSVENK